MPPPPVDRTDLTALDGANAFRQQLLVDVDELLRVHHSQIAQHVEHVMKELCGQHSQTPCSFMGSQTTCSFTGSRPKGAKGTTHKHIPRRTGGVGSVSHAEPRSAFWGSEASGVTPRIAVWSSEASDRTCGSDLSSVQCEAVPVPNKAPRTDFRHSYREDMRRKREVAAQRSDSVVEAAFSMNAQASFSRRSPRAKVRRLVESPLFEIATCIVIVVNALFFGLDTQLLVMGNRPVAFDYIATALDAFVVGLSLLDVALQACDGLGDATLTHIRLLRVARIVRIFQVVRVFQVFAPLRILLYCVLNTLRSLIWTIVLVFGLLYMFGILLTQGAHEVLVLGGDHFTDPRERQQYDALERYFGSIELTIFTLFKSVTGGMSWQEASGPLSFVHPFWEFVFTFFISFTVFAVLNVITGVFCESAIDSAAKDQDMAIMARKSDKKLYTQQLRELFRCIDTKGCGHVDFRMLESCLDDEQCQAYFDALGIEPEDAWALFILLDTDDDDHIDVEEFVSGCLRLRGTSRSIDSHIMLHQSRWTMQKVGGLSRGLHKVLEHLSFLSPEGVADVPEPIEADAHLPQGRREEYGESASGPVHRQEAAPGGFTI